MPKQPDVSAKLVLRAEDHILMLHRAHGSWEFPGGRLEWGETPEETIKRELKEELDYTVTGTPEFINLYNYIAKDQSQHSVILHYFLSIEKMPELRTTDEEPDATVVWMTKDEMMNVMPNQKFVEEMYSHR